MNPNGSKILVIVTSIYRLVAAFDSTWNRKWHSSEATLLKSLMEWNQYSFRWARKFSDGIYSCSNLPRFSICDTFPSSIWSIIRKEDISRRRKNRRVVLLGGASSRIEWDMRVYQRQCAGSPSLPSNFVGRWDHRFLVASILKLEFIVSGADYPIY